MRSENVVRLPSNIPRMLRKLFWTFGCTLFRSILLSFLLLLLFRCLYVDSIASYFVMSTLFVIFFCFGCRYCRCCYSFFCQLRFYTKIKIRGSKNREKGDRISEFIFVQWAWAKTTAAIIPRCRHHRMHQLVRGWTFFSCHSRESGNPLSRTT